MWEPVALCCFSRKTGSLVLGSLEVIGAILGLIYGTYVFFTNDTEHLSFICIHEDPKAVRYCVVTLERTAELIAHGILAIYLVQLICAILMIHGVRKNEHFIIAPYLVKNVIYLVLHTIFAALVTVYALWKLNFMLATLLAYFHGALIFLWTYLTLTVRAHFYQLKRGEADYHHRLVEHCELEKGDKANKM